MPSAQFGGECNEFNIPGNQLSPEYFVINPSGEVVIKDAAISQLLVQTITNPIPVAQSVGVSIGISVGAAM